MTAEIEQATAKFIALKRKRDQHTREVVDPARTALKLAEDEERRLVEAVTNASINLGAALDAAAAKPAEADRDEPFEPDGARRGRHGKAR